MAEQTRLPATLASSVEAVTSAQAELRALVYRLADEVATFRRRALAAEGRQRELEAELRAMEPPPATDTPGETGPGLAELAARTKQLEQENAELRARLDEAAARTRQLLERTRFLRQQQEQGEEAR